MTLKEFLTHIQYILEQYPEYANTEILLDLGKSDYEDKRSVKSIDFSANLFLDSDKCKKYTTATIHFRTI
jgi:hypothetical protein